MGSTLFSAIGGLFGSADSLQVSERVIEGTRSKQDTNSLLYVPCLRVIVVSGICGLSIISIAFRKPVFMLDCLEIRSKVLEAIVNEREEVIKAQGPYRLVGPAPPPPQRPCRSGFGAGAVLN